MSGVDIDQSLDMDISDDSDPFADQDSIELLCVHYTNLSIEAYNERRLSWADMVEEEEDLSSANYWGNDPPLLTLEPETYTSSPLSFTREYSEDTHQYDSKANTDNGADTFFNNFGEDAEDEVSWSSAAHPDEDDGKGLQKIRLSQVLMKQVGKKTSLRDLVLLRAACKIGKHDICAAGGDYGKAWGLVNSWDYWISGYISDYFWRDLRVLK